MFIRICKLELALALFIPTFAMANQKVDDCVRDKIEGEHQFIQLILERCDLTAEDMPALVGKLKNISISDLEFRDNDTGSGGIGDKGLEILMQLKNLRGLSLSRNGITDEGVKYLADSGIKYVELYGNSITAKGAAVLAEFDFIEVLDVGGNFLGDEGVAALAKSESIYGLDVSNNRVSLKGALALSSNNHIARLFMRDNNIGDRGFIALMSMPKLTGIEAMGNNISDASIPAAAANKSLNFIVLERNYITDAGVFEFIGKANGTYDFLDFSENYRVSCQGIKALKDKYGKSVHENSPCHDSYCKKHLPFGKRLNS